MCYHHKNTNRIEYKVLLKAQMGVAPKYLRYAIQLPTSASSLRPLHSLDRWGLFVPRTKTTMAKSRSFSLAGPSLWNCLPLSAHSSFLSSNLSTSLLLLKTCLFFLELIETKSASVGPRLLRGTI